MIGREQLYRDAFAAELHSLRVLLHDKRERFQPLRAGGSSTDPRTPHRHPEEATPQGGFQPEDIRNATWKTVRRLYLNMPGMVGLTTMNRWWVEYSWDLARINSGKYDDSIHTPLALRAVQAVEGWTLALVVEARTWRPLREGEACVFGGVDIVEDNPPHPIEMVTRR